MKFYGSIGFSYEQETAPGVWTTKTEEHQAYGDVLSNVRRWENTGNVNDDLVVNNQISVIASSFVCEHMDAMKYVVWNTTKWSIKSVELDGVRAILTLGDVYHGE